MKKIGFALCLLCVVALFAFTPKGERTLEIGQETKAMEMPVFDFNGNEHKLSYFAKKNGLLVIFSCNTCPFVVAWQDRYPELANYARNHELGMVLVNSNEAKRTGDDSVENMIKHARQNGYDFPYVTDPNSAIANTMFAKTTPHVFLFDGSKKLAYKGAIDDNYKDKDAVQNHYLMDAMTAIVNGKPVKVTTTKATGCSIKRTK